MAQRLSWCKRHVQACRLIADGILVLQVSLPPLGLFFVSAQPRIAIIVAALPGLLQLFYHRVVDKHR